MTLGIIGYGVSIPRYRIKISELGETWGNSFPDELEKTVPSWDEDSITMAVEAVQNSVKNSNGKESEIGAVYLGTTTNPYLEKQGSSIIASTLDVKTETQQADFSNSARSSTLAMLSCMNAVKSNEIECGVVVGSDTLFAKPGSRFDYLSSSGAGAILLGKKPVIAEIEGAYSYSTELTERFRTEENPLPKGTLPRFERKGFLNHVSKAAEGLMEEVERDSDDFDYAVFTTPNLRYPSRVGKEIGLSQEKITPGMVASKIGFTGSSSVMISLAAVLDKAKKGERIMMISYGNGGSDAFSILANKNIERKKQNMVDSYLQRKKFVDVPTYLRFNKRLERVF